MAALVRNAHTRAPLGLISAASIGFAVVQLDVTVVNVALPRSGIRRAAAARAPSR